MNIDQLLARAISLHKDQTHSKWQELDALWSQVKARHQHILFKSIGDMTGPGWWKVLDEAFAQIDALMAQHPDQVFQVMQIKEKFGGLRFYWSAYQKGDDAVAVERVEALHAELDKIVYQTEEACSRTCEVCGEPGEVRTGGWLRTLCDVHHQERLRDVK